MQRIVIKNIEILSPTEKSKAMTLLEEAHKKAERMLHNEVELILYVKEYKTEGSDTKKKKYSLTLDCKSETKHFKSESVEWDFRRTLHKAIEKLMTEIEHKFHVSEQR